MGKILAIFLVCLFLVTFVHTFLIGRILPNNDNAIKNAQVENSNSIITVTEDGWALPIKNGKFCPPNQL